MENETVGSAAEVETVETFTTAETAYGLETAAIEAGIEAGHIRWFGGERGKSLKAVKVKADKEKGRTAGEWSYEKLEAVDLEGMVLLAGGKLEPQTSRGDKKAEDTRTKAQKAKGVPDHFNYGLDLEVKRAIRRKIEGKTIDPEKAIEKMAALLVKFGVAKTETAALVLARKQYAEAMAAGNEPDEDDDDETEGDE